ncbi:unnamed protein product [Rhizophagus irregularis]|uniref:Uncharacterized protein n=1 Tax=Rhizophagus irregularis TaxID=588596 RepID=A0A915ZG83_9GLOM|nr:unnamed protein product [Rhizophagus irregularis]CAB5375056.1 unnamed protein product [Rhizophagus irregularis]
MEEPIKVASVILWLHDDKGIVHGFLTNIKFIGLYQKCWEELDKRPKFSQVNSALNSIDPENNKASSVPYSKGSEESLFLLQKLRNNRQNLMSSDDICFLWRKLKKMMPDVA